MRMRQWWFLNVVLAGVAVLMAGRVRSDWKRGNERYAQLEQRSAATANVSVMSEPERPLTSVVEIVSKNLFMPDRNNALPQPAFVAAAPPPVVIGTMRLGADYEALMAEAGQSGTPRFRRVKTGEQVGPHTVVEIRDEAVVVEFQGLRTVVNVYQSAKSVIRAASSSGAATRAPAAPVVDSVASPGSATTGTAAAPTPASPSGASRTMGEVTVTIEGNRKRYERWTMFGPQVWYEDIK